MRIAALYDIHGNLPALEAVLREIREEGVDRIVVGGDVLPGPIVHETLRCLLDIEVPVDFIHGNGESAILASRAGRAIDGLPEQAREAVRWVAAQLTPEHERLLSGWSATCTLDHPRLGEVLFCHATPRSDTEIFTRMTATDRLRPLFDPLSVPLVVCGHTHMQFDRRVGPTRVVNAGSVGMPFGSTDACWLLLATEVHLRRTPYDRSHAAERMRETAYPRVDDFVSRFVLETPSEQEMLRQFSAAELPP
jgi:predicted phosphodiesterase